MLRLKVIPTLPFHLSLSLVLVCINLDIYFKCGDINDKIIRHTLIVTNTKDNGDGELLGKLGRVGQLGSH